MNDKPEEIESFFNSEERPSSNRVSSVALMNDLDDPNDPSIRASNELVLPPVIMRSSQTFESPFSQEENRQFNYPESSI